MKSGVKSPTFNLAGAVFHSSVLLTTLGDRLASYCPNIVKQLLQLRLVMRSATGVLSRDLGPASGNSLR